MPTPAALRSRPRPRRREATGGGWLIPSWMFSFLLHAGVIALLAVWMRDWQGPAVGFSDVASNELGIVLISDGTSLDPVEREGDGDSAADNSSDAPPEDAPSTVAMPTTASPLLPQATPSTPIPTGPGAGPAFPSSVQADPRELIKGSGGGQSVGGRLGGGMPGAAFMGARDNGSRVVFVIDCSASMANYGAMRSAKAALASSLQSLSETQQFQVIFYNQVAELIKVRGAPNGELLFATELNKTFARQYISGVEPDLGTDHIPALKLGLKMSPEVIFFLTDADEPQLTASQLNDLQKLNQGRTRIHTIEFGRGAELDVDNFLKKLARQNGGTYRYFDVRRLSD